LKSATWKPPKDAEPGDQRHGDWTRERLLKMDARFQSALERAFKDGTEHRRSAATHGAISTRPRVHYVVTAKCWQIRLTLESAEVDTRANGAIQVVREPSDTAFSGLESGLSIMGGGISAAANCCRQTDRCRNDARRC
jgi:hypothetical protein